MFPSSFDASAISFSALRPDIGSMILIPVMWWAKCGNESLSLTGVTFFMRRADVR